MKLLLVQADVGHLTNEAKEEIKSELKEGIAQGFYVYDKSLDISVAEIEDVAIRKIEAPDSGLFEVGKQMYCHGSY
ncbi:hypothetical protein NG20_07840 [Bacillus subtilis]|uniref:hypothetical protein n=1 Tax=Bacillus subtilis TaxID=1423 RepID=UPI0005A47217|nr:hypothetical protein [Bacillus subtilis]KIO60028.1 hypothetical protein B4143_2757 [Bacillus subtilis]KKJ80928.1 hypothetical protein NG20_07840 [Bacillus subtilis]